MKVNTMSVGNHWLFTQQQLEETPSRREMSRVEEDQVRRDGVKMIMEIGQLLKLTSNPTLATASVFFHRFYMFHAFSEHPKNITALACLFLAGKVEETPKKCRDIVAMAKEKYPLEYVSRNLMDEVMSLERILLQTIRFDLHVEHPYVFLLQYAKSFKLDREKMSQILTNAWTFINDSCSTTLCLQWEPEVVAIALLYMAFKMAAVEGETLDWKDRHPDEQWWDSYVANLTVAMIDDICHRFLDYYNE